MPRFFVSYPQGFLPKWQDWGTEPAQVENTTSTRSSADRASASEAEGHRFESCRVRQSLGASVEERFNRGSHAELRIFADLVRRGYTVSVPLGHEARYDCIADKDGTLFRIQCKSARIFRDAVLVKCNSSPGGKDVRYQEGEIDMIAAYEATTDTVYYVPYDVAKDRSRAVSLRLKPARNNQTAGTRPASAFLEI